MRKQPDFTKIFFDYFGGSPRKVNYAIRPWANCGHDVIFLSSLIHDARFVPSRITLRRKRLTIPINRDCWELEPAHRENCCEYRVADAKLIFSPVIDYEWRFSTAMTFSSDVELWLHRLAWQRESDETLVFDIEGHEWLLRIKVPDIDFQAKLMDMEVPYFFSEGHVG